MPHERDERWVYVALAALAVAYVIWRYRAPSAVELPKINWRAVGKAGSVLPYLAATAIGVIVQHLARRRHEALRKEWEARMATEGLVRAEAGVRMWVLDARWRRRQHFEAQLKLTRAALYVFEHSGKREPLRFALRRDDQGAPYVQDASIVPEGGAYGVRVAVAGAGGTALEFASPDAQAWWIDLRKALGKGTDVEAAVRAADSGAVTAGATETDWKDALTWRDTGR